MVCWTETHDGLLCRLPPAWALIAPRKQKSGWIATVHISDQNRDTWIFHSLDKARDWCEELLTRAGQTRDRPLDSKQGIAHD